MQVFFTDKHFSETEFEQLEDLADVSIFCLEFPKAILQTMPMVYRWRLFLNFAQKFAEEHEKVL